MNKLKHKVEALLFSSGRAMSLEELRKLTRGSPEEIRSAISEISEDLKARNSSILLSDEGQDAWKLTVQNDHISLVRKIVSKTELKKSLLETLAIIAWKAPVLQSEIIKVRTNKAYDDLRDLESLNYITRAKKGRTKLIKLSSKFFEYFDIPPEKIKERFARFDQMESDIIEKEKASEEANRKLEEIRQIQDEEQKKLDKLGSLEIVDEPDIKGSSDPDKVEEYGEGEEVAIIKDKMGDLDIVDEPPETKKGKSNEEEAEPEEKEEGSEESEEEPENKGSAEEEKEEPSKEESEPEEKEEEISEEKEGAEDDGVAKGSDTSEDEEEKKEDEDSEEDQGSEDESKSKEDDKDKEGQKDGSKPSEESGEQSEETKESISRHLEEKRVDKEIDDKINQEMEMLLHPEKVQNKKDASDEEEPEQK